MSSTSLTFEKVSSIALSYYREPGSRGDLYLDRQDKVVRRTGSQVREACRLTLLAADGIDPPEYAVLVERTGEGDANNPRSVTTVAAVGDVRELLARVLEDLADGIDEIEPAIFYGALALFTAAGVTLDTWQLAALRSSREVREGLVQLGDAQTRSPRNGAGRSRAST
jgi:hypothetical protein